jgi:hypothetical protein
VHTLASKGKFAGLRLRASAAAVLLVICGSGASELRAGTELLGQFENWRAYVSQQGESKLCFARTEPVASKGAESSRKETALTVSHRPQDKVRNEISVLAGYVYKPKTQVEVAISGKKFFLFVDGDSAWAEDEKIDEAVVKELMKGSKLTVRGTSARGTTTTDTYSLKGSTAALKKISEACGVK